MMSNILGASRFDQCVMTMALIHLCNRESHVGNEMRSLYTDAEHGGDRWFSPHWFTIYVPHPDQEYDGITLEAGLNQGYNIEVKPIGDGESLPYAIPRGGHFVVVLKQRGVNQDFGIAATGIFVRPLAVLCLDIIVDPDKPEYQAIVVKHPIIRDYPSAWEQKIQLFRDRQLASEDLPDLVRYVDQTLNLDYRSPSWQEISLAAQGFAGV